MKEAIKPGDVVKHHRFEHPVGHGAYGSVWKATHELLNVPVAVKVIDTYDLDEENRQRVLQECQIGGKLSDEAGVVHVRDAFIEDDLLFIVMERMDQNLAQYLRENRYPDLGLTLDWMLTLVKALAEVHQAGIVHRDIKPTNILLSEKPEIKLGDFGISHLPDSEITTVYQPGTKGYWAPEQELNQSVDGRTDVYSLCAVFFEVWTGLKWIQHKHEPQSHVREEADFQLKENYTELPGTLRQRLVDLLLAGLRARPERISLAKLQDALAGIIRDWEQHQKDESVVNTAREEVAEQVRAARSPTVVSNLPQRPVEERSRPAGRTALIDWLQDEWGQWYQRHPDRNIVLWYDEARQWELLLDNLYSGLNLLHYDGSLLHMRYQLEQQPGEELVVAYLPMAQDEDDYLLPFHFTSYIFDKSIYEVLLEHNMPLLRSGPQRRQLKEMLPQLACESIGKGAAFWQNITDVQKARATLLSDFGGRLSQFLDQPDPTWTSLHAEGRHEHFLSMVASQYGFDAAMSEPASLARRFVTHLCLVDLYHQTGNPHDFPLFHLLPEPHYFDACGSLLRSWRNDRRYAHRFQHYTRQVEEDYPSLLSWAKPHLDKLKTPPLPGLARAAWEEMAEKIVAWESFDDAVAGVRANNSRIERAARSYWTASGETVGWKALEIAGRVLTSIDEALERAENVKSATDAIRAYTEEWWQIDREYRLAKRALETPFAGYKELAGWIDRYYRKFLSQVNQRWTAQLDGQNEWNFPGVLPRQHSFWEKTSEGNGQRRAIFLVDALRFELGKSLQELLPAEYDVAIEPMLANLPSVTPVGMSALMPDAEKRKFEWQKNEWEITIPGFEGNLASKNNRDEWLARKLGNVRIVDLSQLLKPETEIEEGPSWLIVTTTVIDAIGENVGALSPGMLDELVDKVRQGVRRVIQAGFGVVHIATDHGFLLLDRVADHGKAELPDMEWLKKSPRYAIGRDLPETDHLHFPVAGSDNLIGWYPHGVICFKAYGQYNYVHGGPSLQEVIVPHLRVTASQLGTPVGVTIEANTETRIAIFKVTLEPVAQGLVPQEREVRLTLEHEDGIVIRESTEILSPGNPVVKNLKLLPADDVGFGETLYITVYDARTQEQLDRHPIRYQVSAEL